MMDVNRNPEIQRLLASLRNANSGTSTAFSGTSIASANSQAAGFSREPRHSAGGIPGLGTFSQHEIDVSSSRYDVPKLSTPTPSSNTQQAHKDHDKPEIKIVPDASTITTWPAGLKHVTKYVVPDDKVVARIKHLIHEQHKHERQWWTAREAIVARQNGRIGNQQKAADLLKSLGGLAIPVASSDPEADKAELDVFDRKVYKGLVDMAADFDKQMRNMGIPFFAVKHELIVLENGKEKDVSQKARLDKGELRELQRKMIQTLEDLFGEE